MILPETLLIGISIVAVQRMVASLSDVPQFGDPSPSSIVIVWPVESEIITARDVDDRGFAPRESGISIDTANLTEAFTCSTCETVRRTGCGAGTAAGAVSAPAQDEIAAPLTKMAMKAAPEMRLTSDTANGQARPV